jgi:hypothetical protein
MLKLAVREMCCSVRTLGSKNVKLRISRALRAITKLLSIGKTIPLLRLAHFVSSRYDWAVTTLVGKGDKLHQVPFVHARLRIELRQGKGT